MITLSPNQSYCSDKATQFRRRETVLDQPTTCGVARTPFASRYLQQLCKHWSHTASVQFDAFRGAVHFESGEEVELIAENDALHITARVRAGADLDAWKTVIDAHLIRFAFRETLKVDWSSQCSEQSGNPEQ